MGLATTLKNAVISILLRTHNHCLVMDGKAGLSLPVVQLRKLHDTAGYLWPSNTELLSMFPSCCHSVHGHLPSSAEAGSEVCTEMGRGGGRKLVWAERGNLATWHMWATRSTTHEDSAFTAMSVCTAYLPVWFFRLCIGPHLSPEIVPFAWSSWARLVFMWLSPRSPKLCHMAGSCVYKLFIRLP